MNAIMKTEWYKLKRKKDVCILSVLLILIPILFALCIKFKIGKINFSGDQVVTIPDFAVGIWAIMKMLFLPYLLITYVGLSFLGKEMEQKTISIELLKSSRKNVVLSKMIISGILTAFEVLLVFLTGIFGATMLDGTVAQTFTLSDGHWSLIMMIIIQILAMLLLVSFANLVGTFCGNIKAMLIVLGTIILQKGLGQVGIFEKFLPESVLNPSGYIDAVANLGSTAALKYNLGILAYAIILILVLNLITYRVWAKRDFM